MADYRVKFTDTNVDPTLVTESEMNTDHAVKLFGRIKAEYGEDLNQNLLNLLENFACPEKAGSELRTAEPDKTRASDEQFTNPVDGQIWFNSTRKTIYYWNTNAWIPVAMREAYAANWGSVMDGQQLPRPVSPLSGYTFDYDECIWSVSPAAINGGAPSFISCGTDDLARVTMKYKMKGFNYTINGLANYLIIGIRGNFNTGQNQPVVTPPAPTVSSTPGTTVTPTPTRSPSRTPLVTPTRSPSRPAAPQPATPPPTPTPAASSTAQPTPTPAPSSTAQPTPTPAPSSTPAPTPPPVIEFMCECPGMAYFNGAFYNTSGQYRTLAECELNKRPGEICDSTYRFDPGPNAQCWSAFNPYREPGEMACRMQ